jgi:hypothetical protein
MVAGDAGDPGGLLAKMIEVLLRKDGEICHKISVITEF